jgi:hypothetical protein
MGDLIEFLGAIGEVVAAILDGGRTYGDNCELSDANPLNYRDPPTESSDDVGAAGESR